MKNFFSGFIDFKICHREFPHNACPLTNYNWRKRGRQIPAGFCPPPPLLKTGQHATDSVNRLDEYGYAGLYKALKHKYKYALSTNLPCVSRHSQFLALLCIFPELIISLQESCALWQSFSSYFLPFWMP